MPERSAKDRFGYMLRKWRKARGLSQDRLGAMVHVSGDLLHKIELAHRGASESLAEHCERVLDANGELLSAWHDMDQEAQRRRDTDTSAVGTYTSAVDTNIPRDDPFNGSTGLSGRGGEEGFIVVQMMSLNGEMVPVAVDRRTFVTSAVALPVVGWLGGGQGIAPIPGRVADGDLRDIARDMVSLRVVLARQDNVLGSAVAAPTVIHQLFVLQRLSAKSKGEARELLMRLQAAYAEFGSWLSDELGDRKIGQYWIDRALEWSHEAADDLAVGYILARKAQRAIEENEPSAAISLARAARRCRDITDRVRAAAWQYEALGHASTGDAAEFNAAIEHAHELTSSLPPANDDDWAAWCTPGYVTMHEAGGWMRLGNPKRAVTAYEHGLKDWPHEFVRDEGVYYGRLAHAQAVAGNADGMQQAGRKALDIAARTGSARILAELRPLPSVLTEWSDSVSVKNFGTDLVHALSARGDSTTR